MDNICQTINTINYQGRCYRQQSNGHQLVIVRLMSMGYTLSEAWSGVNWADLMAAQGAFGTNFYDRSTRTIVGTMLWTEYRPKRSQRSAQFTPLQASDRV